MESGKDPQIDKHFGEIKAELLTFKGIPYQIKLTSADQELREQLPQTYVDHMTQAQTEHDNIVFMRKWLDLGNRYGNIEEVMDGVLENDSYLSRITVARIGKTCFRRKSRH